MTCPCIEMREKAAKLCEGRRTHHPHRDNHIQDTVLTLAADAIRALPPCGRCETGVWVPKEFLSRVNDGLQRWIYGDPPRRIPADVSDGDILQVEVKAMLAAREGK